jgi:DNA-binding LacI/PurR family transcriptional regulator
VDGLLVPLAAEVPEASWANGERLRALTAASAFGSRSYRAGPTRPRVRAASKVPLADVTAIATYNDLIPLGALARLRAGVVVPEAISVVGFDDISLDHVAHSQLTTVSVARDEVGRRAMTLRLQPPNDRDAIAALNHA